MKYIQLTAILLFTAFIATAQTNNRYIQAVGQTTYKRDVKHYEATIRINNTNTYRNETQLTLEERKALFFEKVNKLGLNKNQVRIADTDENATQKTTEHVDYVVETTDEHDIEKIISLGKIDSWSYKLQEKVVYRPFANKSDIIGKALKDAKKNAEVIADVIGKKIGEVLVISDYNYEDRPGSAYYTKEERTYRIAVHFAIK
ncbi:SIMPL domain-containing protein [Gelidibacter japonicus]|uniref:SIMPL domain-containing protein n=1 Tax=Gelidibacter japonicus TaxID=1962232 RepID=UPI0013D81D85|nr:SIMPL domain-containing protein [Gelidibacter japonicus]